MEKKKTIVIFMSLVVLFAASYMVENETRRSLVGNMGEFSSGARQINAYYFYGDGCPHCSKVKPFIADMERQLPLSINKYEIYNDRNNVALLNQFFDDHAVPREQRGVPALFVLDSYLVGDEPILNEFEGIVSEALETESAVNSASNRVATSPEKSVDEGACRQSTAQSECLAIATVTAAALVDSISPCSLAVLLFLIGVRPLVPDRKMRALKVGLAFVLSVFVTYTLFGLGLLSMIRVAGLSSTFGLLAGLIAIVAGILYVKDSLWHGAGGFAMEIPRSLRPITGRLIKSVTSPVGAFLIGFAICCFELPCTGGPYLFILGQLANTATRLEAIPLLLYYNFLFILPLLLVTLFLYFGFFSIKKVREWSDGNKRLLRMGSGLAIIALGIVVVPSSDMVELIHVFLSVGKAVFPPVLFTLSCYLTLSFLRSNQTMARRLAKTIPLATLLVLSIFAFPQLFEVVQNATELNTELLRGESPSERALGLESTQIDDEKLCGTGDDTCGRADELAESGGDSVLKSQETREFTPEELAEIEERAKLYGEEEEEYVYEPYPPVSIDLLKQYEPDYEKFNGYLIGDKIVYFQKRKIEDAIVEKDSIVYQFDKDSKQLLAKKVSWRDDLPDKLPLMITKENAEAMVEGEVQSSELYFISPESKVFPITPTPESPCWIVNSIDGEKHIVTIIDAVEGKILGYGIPPPVYTGFSLAGPDWGDVAPFDPYYTWYAQNAETWFETMGYDTEMWDNPTQAKVQSHIQSANTAMFYELAHGGSWSFHHTCPDAESITAAEVETWIGAYNKMPFTFLGSCDGMCDQTDNYLSYEFRKGSTKGTVAVGYCGMSGTLCSDCWPLADEWQIALFSYMNAGWTVKAAFDQANADYPDCIDDGWSCMRFAGDTSLTVKPVIKREPSCGDTIKGDTWLSKNLICPGNGLIIGRNDITLDCQGHIIYGSDTGIGIENTYSGVTIKNCVIRDFDYGIYMHSVADNNQLLNNNVLSNDVYGIILDDAWSNYLTLNYVNYNGANGLYLQNAAKYNDIVDNNFENNGWHGIQLSGTSHSNDFSLNYLYGNGWSGMGINTDNNIIEDSTAVYNIYYGFDIRSTTGNRLTNNGIGYNDQYGISLYNSTFTQLVDNDIIGNDYHGVYFGSSNYSVVILSYFYGNLRKGVYLYNSHYNTIQGNDFVRNYNESIYLLYADDNSILQNDITLSGARGIDLRYSNDNTIRFNNVAQSTYMGLYLYESDSNDIWYNFVDNNGDWGVYVYRSDNNDFRHNRVNHPITSGIYSSTSYNTVFQNNTSCGTSWDFYTPSSTYTANENACDDAYLFVDSGQPNACDFKCSGCRRLEDDLYADRDLTFCSGTYNIQDVGNNGIVIAQASGITLTCDHTILDGVTDTGYGIGIYGQSYVTVKDCTLRNFDRGILLSDAGNYNDLINNTITSMYFAGVHILRNSGNNLENNTITSNNQGIRIFSSDGTTVVNNDIMLNSYGVLVYSGSNNYLERNNLCSNSYDIYNMPTGTSGNENKCDSVYNYVDNGQTSECDFECSGCRKAEDDLVLSTNTVLCPYTYNIQDLGSIGVITIGANNMQLDCQGAEMIGVSTSSGWGIRNPGYDYVTVRNCKIRNYWLGIAFETGSNYGNIMNNNASSNSGGIRLLGSNYGTVTGNIANFNTQIGLVVTQNSDYNALTNNIVKGNSITGIAIYSGSDNNDVKFNKVIGNNDGLWIYDSDNNYMHGNIVEDNSGEGLYFSPSTANNNELNHNRVCRNTLDIKDDDANFGDNNFCSTTNNWDDTGTTGCTFTCLLGDIDVDGDVDAFDLYLLGKAYLTTATHPNYHPGADVDVDDDIDEDDLRTLQGNYGKIS